MLVALIALGDMLLWDVTAGLSVAVFAIALVMGAIGAWHSNIAPQRLKMVAMGTLLSVLPVVELVQPLSLLVLTIGVSATLVFLSGVPLHKLAPASVRLWMVAPQHTIEEMRKGAATVGPPSFSHLHWNRFLVGWALPLGLGAVFLLLFVRANPLLSEGLYWLLPKSIPVPNIPRYVVWIALGFLVWPCLTLVRMRERLRQELSFNHSARSVPIINADAVLRSLMIFNGMFAIQTGMDLLFLYGGALPEGMSYAKYAHRGAYPLLATALLAGVFVLIARPFGKDIPLIRFLLLIWIVQTLALVLASVVRLDTYVEIYGLTRLRLAAFVWMGVVTAGLCITWVQIWKDAPSRWMLVRVSLLGAAVLYLCACTSFDRVIAQYNLTQDVKVDWTYMCSLGEGAAPVIVKHAGLRPVQSCGAFNISTPDDWREWGFRNWRTRRSLAKLISGVPLP